MQDIKQALSTKKIWYKRPGVLLLIVIFIIVLSALIAFAFQVVRYTRDIQTGNISTQKFTRSQNTSETVNLDTVILNYWDESNPTFGNPNAKVVIVEFGDFECPYCRQAFPIIRELEQEFKDDVLFVWRDFPLREIHNNAQQASEAARCAHEQGQFWPYHDKLFINQLKFSLPDLKRYAQELGLNTNQFNVCLNAHTYSDDIERDYQDALAAGAQGTPTFIINGQLVSGVIPKETLKKIIIELLKK